MSRERSVPAPAESGHAPFQVRVVVAERKLNKDKQLRGWTSSTTLTTRFLSNLLAWALSTPFINVWHTNVFIFAQFHRQ